MKDNKIEWSPIILTLICSILIMMATDLSFLAYMGVAIFFYLVLVIANEEYKKEESQKELIKQAIKYYSNNNK